MGQYEIMRLVNDIKDTYKTNDPFKLCKLMNFKINKIKLNPKIYKAYITNPFGEPIISINENFTETSQKVLCSHELGHAILHQDSFCNQFNGNDMVKEYEANMFAAALLFNEDDFKVPLHRLSNFELQTLLDYNIKLK